MFDKYLEMMNPATIGILLGLLAIVFFIWWMRRKPAPDAKTTQKVIPPATEMPKVNGYKCKCGEVFPDSKALGKHFITLGRKEKGKHGSAGREEAVVDGVSTPLVKKPSILGTGNLRCMAIRGDTIDFTTIPEPIGELHMADTSMPVSGGLYTVRELKSGEVVDYDPRDIPLVIEETPEYAWFATHWDIVKEVFAVPIKWWQSVANWWVAAILIIDFVAVLVWFGG